MTLALAELHTVFEITHGNALDMNKMTPTTANDPDAVAFVGRSGEKNGIVGFVRALPGVIPFTQGLLSVALGGIALSTFVQPRPFYTAQNVDVLRPRDDMSLDVKLYYCQCVEANRFRYSTFGRDANRTLRTLLVPARESVPPWAEGSTKRAIATLERDLAAVSYGAVR